jgi:general secretion pathway protein L
MGRLLTRRGRRAPVRRTSVSGRPESSEALLLLLTEGGEIGGWSWIGDSPIRWRPAGELPDDAAAREAIAVVPGESVRIEWAALPARLSTAQALAAARLMARDVAIDADSLHLAIGEADADGGRPVAMVSAGLMDAWLNRLRARGLDPAVMIPATLLLAAPAEGLARCAIGAVSLCRGPRQAFCLEHALADLVCAGRTIVTVDEAAYRLGIPAQLDRPRINLRQGGFDAPESADGRPRRRRTAWLATAFATASLLAEAAPAVRDHYAASRLQDKAQAEATAFLADDASGEDPAGALRQEIARSGGGRSGFSAEAAALFAAVAEVGGSEIGGLRYRDGRIEAVVRAESAAPVEAAAESLRRFGYAPTLSPLPRENSSARWALTVQAR